MIIPSQCPTVKALEALQLAAIAAGLPQYLVHDAGHTQIDPGTATVLCIGAFRTDRRHVFRAA